MDYPVSERIDLESVEFVSSADGTRLAVRTSGLEGTGAPVVILHGLQSHAGWFMQSQAFLAHGGFPVYAMDRRGSGQSEGTPGECTDFREMIDDVRAVVDFACARHCCEKVHGLGHCFGAIPAALFACAHPERIASLVLASSGIHTKVGVGLAKKWAILWSKVSKRAVRLAVPLVPEMFSELESSVRFIREDDAKLASVTASFYYEVLRARRYLRAQRHRLDMPVFMANAGGDPICDNAANERFLWSLPSQQKLLVTYRHARHVIEFSRQRDDFFRDVAWWLARFGGRNHAGGG